MSKTILHVTASLKPHAGSVAICLDHLFPLLKQRGFDSRVITCDTKPIKCAAAAVHGFEPENLSRLIREVDIIHLHGLADGLADRVIEQTDRPIVLSPLGELCEEADAPNGWFARRRRRARVRKYLESTTVTALNEVEREAIGASETLTYGLDMASIDSLACDDADLPDIGDQKCLLFLGAIDPKEGLVGLLRALAELGTMFDGWHVLLAGVDADGWGAQLEAAVNRKGGAHQVTFVSDPDWQTQVGLMRRADLLVAPSLAVRSPVAVQMAVAMGVPVLASPVVALDGAADHVHVCDPNPADLRRALAQLVAPEDARSPDGSPTGVDWADHIDDWLNLYARCAP